MNQTVVGYFDTRAQAQEAVRRLEAAGFPAGSAQLSDEAPYDVTTRTEADSGGVLSGIRHFFSDVFGDNHEHMNDYEEAVRRGGCVVKVTVASDAELDQATDVLEDAGAADIDERATQWRESSTAGTSTGLAGSAAMVGASSVGAASGAASYAADTSIASELTASQTAAIPVVEESLEVGKRTVDRGGVRVYSRTIETPVNESVTLREERAVVERRAVDRPLTDAEADGFQERSIEVREMAEKAVVSKTARVVEEVVVGKQATERTEQIADSVRHTEVEVERIEGGTSGVSSAAGSASSARLAGEAAVGSGTTMSSFSSDPAYIDAYRSDYDTRYASLGGSYDDYEPAYRYGHSVANDQAYTGRDWDSVEPTLKSDWSTKNPGSSWEKVKDGVKHAWHVAKG